MGILYQGARGAVGVCVHIACHTGKVGLILRAVKAVKAWSKGHSPLPHHLCKKNAHRCCHIHAHISGDSLGLCLQAFIKAYL